MLVDSGGFASLFKNARLVSSGKLGAIEIYTDDGVELVHPRDVLDHQERVGDVAFTLDFPVPPGMEGPEARHRKNLTIANAHWALANRRRRNLPLYAVVQGWDAESSRTCALTYRNAGFDGIAIGGLVPRARDIDTILTVVRAVRDTLPDVPLHVLGLGKPQIVETLYRAGVDSVDSSSYVKLAADGRLWSTPDMQLKDASTTDRLHMSLCNLAIAAGQALPLSASGLAFLTLSLRTQLHAA